MTRARVGCIATIAVVLMAALPSTALAQLDDTSWGITAGVTPQWTMPGDLFSPLFGDSVTVDIKGPEFRLGVIRGTTRGGEWGVGLVHKRLSKESRVVVTGDDTQLSVTADDAEVLGVEVHRFFPFVRVGHVQVGANFGAGVGQLRGFVRGSLIPLRGSSSTAAEVTLPFSEAFAVSGGRNVDIIPLGRAELAAAFLVGERMKVRVSGGLNLPGVQIVSLSFSYLLGQDR